MTLIDGLLIFLFIVLIYALSVFIMSKKGILKKFNIALYGPALLLRTERGKKFLKRISRRKRFWKAYGSFAIFFCFLMMIIFTVIIIWNTWMAFGFLDLPPEEKANLPGPELALVLPGINPILPLGYLGYVVLALVVAIVVHEFSHGILTFLAKVKVKSLGILYLIIPIGAFVEPDEEELKKVDIVKRMRVYAVGPLSNFIVAFVTLLIFSFVLMSAVQPVEGAHVFYTVEDYPAEEIGLAAGSVITSLNDTELSDLSDFYYVMQNTTAHQTVNISYYKGEMIHTTVTFADYYDYTNNESHINSSFLGVGFNPYKNYIYYLKNPFRANFLDSFLLLYSVPIFGYLAGYNPISEPFTDSYMLTGPLSGLPANVFWILVTAMYWIFWLNLAVGLFNVLPMMPLDGGFLFNDAIKSLVNRREHLTEEKREQLVRKISIIVSLTILFVIIFPFIVKYI